MLLAAWAEQRRRRQQQGCALAAAQAAALCPHCQLRSTAGEQAWRQRALLVVLPPFVAPAGPLTAAAAEVASPQSHQWRRLLTPAPDCCCCCCLLQAGRLSAPGTGRHRRQHRRHVLAPAGCAWCHCCCCCWPCQAARSAPAWRPRRCCLHRWRRHGGGFQRAHCAMPSPRLVMSLQAGCQPRPPSPGCASSTAAAALAAAGPCRQRRRRHGAWQGRLERPRRLRAFHATLVLQQKAAECSRKGHWTD
jgi:hypothetical protein